MDTIRTFFTNIRALFPIFKKGQWKPPSVLPSCAPALYCFKCKGVTERKKPRISKISNGRTMLLSKCAVCNSKNLRFIKEQEASELLSQLGIRVPFSKITLLNNILLWKYKKANALINKCLLSRDKFMSEIHLRQLGFLYSLLKVNIKIAKI